MRHMRAREYGYDGVLDEKQEWSSIKQYCAVRRSENRVRRSENKLGRRRLVWLTKRTKPVYDMRHGGDDKKSAIARSMGSVNQLALDLGSSSGEHPKAHPMRICVG